MVDKAKNDAIVKAAKAWTRLPFQQRTQEAALRLFAQFNTNNNGTSKDVLNSVDKIDDYFKDVMGMSVIKTGISKQDFIENIDDWAPEFAKYQAPAEKPKPKTPYAKVKDDDATALANDLVYKLAPLGNTSQLGSFFSDWIGDDDGRYDESSALFGEGKDKINESNIVEVLNKLTPSVLNRAISTLDEDKEPEIRSFIGQALTDRIDTLKKNNLLTDAEYQTAATLISKIEANENFDASIMRIRKMLYNKGVAQ